MKIPQLHVFDMPHWLRRLHWLRKAGIPLLLGCAASLPAAHAADALNGKSLYLNGPTSGGTSCSACHGASPANNVNGILRAANDPAVILAAWAANKGGMGTLFNNKFTNEQVADLAAFIGNPGVTAGPTASVSPSSLTFSGTTIGQSSSALGATLSNTGAAALNITTVNISGAAAADFSTAGSTCVNGGTLAPGASCNAQVSFTPTASGTRSATLNINHNATGGVSTVSLTGTGNAAPQASIGVSATNVNFGAVITNVASPAQTITISNSGQAALSFSAISITGVNAGLFTLGGSCATQTAVAAGGSCTVTVQALATALGPFSATLNLNSNAANGNASVSLSGTASLPAPSATANPASVNFGSQTIGSAGTSQAVTVANSGNVALNIASIAVGGSNAVSIGAPNTCGATLAVGASCSVSLVFAPTVAGAVNATLNVNSNAAPVQVAVTGTGTALATAKPALSESGPIAFADTQVGKTSVTHTTTLSNAGSAALKIATLVLSGNQASDFSLGGTCAVNGTVSPSASCTIESVFKPSAAGARNASLLVVTDSGTQLGLDLAGNGIAVAGPVATLTVQPQSFDFGKVVIGSTPVIKRFALSNTGTSAVTLNSTVFSGPFSAVADATGCAAMPFTLQPGASCDLVVQYAPTVAGAGNGTALIQSNDVTMNWTIPLTGQANVAVVSVTTENKGGGGCSAVRGGNDPLLPAMVLLAIGVIVWRRRQANEALPLSKR